MIEKAYRIGKEAHRDQVRKSGEPYIIHPLWVGIILADLEMDKETIVAGMLHDAVEDTDMTLDDVAGEFGEEVALLVDGVTKLGTVELFTGQIRSSGREPAGRCFLRWRRTSGLLLLNWQTDCIICVHLEFMTPDKAAGKSKRDDGYLCADRAATRYFQD